MLGGGALSGGSTRSSAASTIARRSSRYALRSILTGAPRRRAPRLARPRSRLVLPLEDEGPGGGGAALVLDEHLDAALGVVEIAGAVAGQRDAFFEHLERFFERQVATLEGAHDLLEPGETVFKLEVAHHAPVSRPRDSRGVLRAAARGGRPSAGGARAGRPPRGRSRGAAGR